VLILVAASDPALCTALAAAVRRAGHAVLTAHDGAGAWAAYLTHRPPLLVLDVHLAAGSGEGAGDAHALCRRVHDAAARSADAEPCDAEPGHGAAWEPLGEAPPDDPLGPFVLVALPRDGSTDLEAVLAAGADDFLTTPPSARNVAARLAIAERRMHDAVAAGRSERALLRARWLAGIGETSIAVQHEINNPLAALLGHAALLQQGLVEPGEERELLGVVMEQAQRIATVMKRLAALRDPRSVEYLGAARMLDLSRPPAGRAPDDAAPAGAPPAPG
jgi:DNA-binding response OmpR family regulator